MDARRIFQPLRGSRSRDSLERPVITPEQVYHDHASRIYSIARKMVRNESDAEDVAQDVFLQVVRKLPDFRGDSAVPTWLHRVTVNAALALRRKQATRAVHEACVSVAGEFEGETAEPATPLLNRETQQLIEEAIASLPEMYREVFVLSDVEGLPNADIAEQLELSLPAVKSRLHRARSLLRTLLAPHFDEFPA